MAHSQAEQRFITAEQEIDLKSAVRGLHGISSQELHKLLRDSENFTILYNSEEGVSVKINVETLAELLPMHLIAALMTYERNESLFMYMLSGIRLLNSLYDLAPRHPKLEQVLLDDLKTLEHLIDLELECSSIGHLLYSALMGSNLCLLTECLSPHWDEIAPVLLVHPKVDLFMDAAFGAVHVAIGFLEMKLSSDIKLCSHPVLKVEQIVNYLCNQCEVSLQFLQSMCQQKKFRERMLRNKELCGRGGVLFLAQTIMKLSITPAEGYLDDVASVPNSLDVAKSVALEGSEVTCAQLKNWLNNRKARLARVAKEARATPDSDSKHPGRGPGLSCDSPESPSEDIHGGPQSKLKASAGGSSNITIAKLIETGPAKFVQCEPDQYVMLVDGEGLEIGKGEVRQVRGWWFTTRLEEAETCVVDITYLKAEKHRRLPYPSEASGSTFEEAERMFGAIRVMWDSNKMFMLQHQ